MPAMMRILTLLASGLPLALAWSVRGFAATGGSTLRRAAPAATPAAAPAASPAASPAAALNGTEEQVVVKPLGTNCTCEKAFNSLGANSSKADCRKLQDSCGHELELGCSDKVNTCMGKFNQAGSGTVGFVLDANKLAEASFCGPFGKCLGELRLVARVWRPEGDLRLACAVPSVSIANATGNATGGTATDRPNCKGDCMKKCSADVKNKTANCTIPMVPNLAPGAKLTGSCWLEKSKGTKVTDADYFAIVNKYK
mmetsp:Transcript_130773/g.260907  ORF Transcript_130773/g.260907 Transcript_130773/m.260907 type:complete len:255 (-) Transcript_130773:94-858(-)